MLKNKRSEEIKWQPSASIETLKLRAHLLSKIRDFFRERGVMEVETPLMSHTSVTDPHIHSIPVRFQWHPSKPHQSYYLQTSPEYAMKRLLASGIGSIYQITKAFRQGEVGDLHNPEFTLLEWYRVGFDHHALMDEMDEFLQCILGCKGCEKKRYAELFEHFLGIDPHQADVATLSVCARDANLDIQEKNLDRDDWLLLLMSYLIEPFLGKDIPCFVYDFPASLAALARINPYNANVASRFEVYFHGIELANGFHELNDAREQRQRFQKNCMERKKLGFEEIAIDENFIAALDAGLPDCAGVALGIDRLLMLSTQHKCIADVISFDITRA